MSLTSFVYCEICKVYKSSVFWVVIIAFTLLPTLGLVKYFGAADVSWGVYLADVLGMFVSLLIIGFAFTTCWIFGREYTDKTISDLLVKPVPKLTIAMSKFIVIFLWNSLLTTIMLMVTLLLGAYMGLIGGTTTLLLHYFLLFMTISLLIMFVSTVSSFMANVTKGYLAPIGLIFLIVVIVNVAPNVGLSAYVPWTIPGLLLSDGFLRPISILILTITGIIGLVGTVAWWRFVEQK